MPLLSQEQYTKTLDALAIMRRSLASLRQAASEAGIAPKTAKKVAGPALRKGKTGRYTANHGDQLLRVLRVPTAEGLREVGVRGSARARAVGRHAAAILRYFATGDFGPLSRFAGKGIKDDAGNIVPFLVDRDALKKLGHAALSYESIYVQGA